MKLPAVAAGLLAALLACASGAARAAGGAGPPDADCAPVAAALQRAADEPQVRMQARVLEGHAPAGYVSMTTQLADGVQWLELDGRRYGPGPASEPAQRAEASGIAALEPVGRCEPAAVESVGTRVMSHHRYAGWSEAGESRVDLWIDRATGLPAVAVIDAPEGTLARVLSRPTTPPQVTLRPNGRRYRERRSFDWGS